MKIFCQKFYFLVDKMNTAVHSKPVVLKLYHVKNPQINTYQPVDPIWRDTPGTPIREDVNSIAMIANYFNLKDPECDMHSATDPRLMVFLSLGPQFKL